MGGKSRGNRRHGPGSSGDGGRKRRRYVTATASENRARGGNEWQEVDSDSDSGALHIGGMRIVTGRRANRLARRQGRAHQAGGGSGYLSEDCTAQQRMSDSGGSMDDILRDYAQNLLEAEDEDSERHETEAEESRGMRSVVGMFASLGTGEDIFDPAEGRPPEDIGPAWTSDDDRSGSDSDNARRMRAMYPVQVRPPRYNEDDDPMAVHLDMQQRRRRKLLPGEKKQMRKEKILAKRAARAAAKGFSPFQSNEALLDMVERNGDMHAFSPTGKVETHLVQRLAAVYGLKSSIQGSGKKRFVVVRRTASTAMPNSIAMAEIQELLQQHHKLTRIGETAKAAAARNDPNSMLPAIGADSPRRARSAAKPRSRGSASYSRPVGFVRSHVQTADNPVEVFPPSEIRLPQGEGVTSSEDQGFELQTEASGALLSPDRPTNLEQGYENELSEEEFSDLNDRSVASIELGLGTAGLGFGGGSPLETQNDIGSASELQKMEIADKGAGPGETSECVSSGGGADSTLPPSSGSSIMMEAGAWQSVGRAATKAAAKKAKKKAEKMQRRAERQNAQRGLGTRPGPGASGGQARSGVALQYGGFEVHTTGFGSRMLARMGFAGEGAGLGATAQGIAEPIQATLRPRQLGLGHSGFDSR